MKTIISLLAGLALNAFGADSAIPDGNYSPPVPLFGRRFLELKDGRFTLRYVSDTGPDPTRKPLFADIEKGRFQVDGKRLILLGDNPLLGEVLFYREVDGISVLLTQQAVSYDHFYGHPVYEYFALKPKEAAEGVEWWYSLLKAHPTFAKWVNQ